MMQLPSSWQMYLRQRKKDDTVLNKVTDAATKVMSTPLRKKKDETFFEKMNTSATKMISALKCSD